MAFGVEKPKVLIRILELLVFYCIQQKCLFHNFSNMVYHFHCFVYSSVLMSVSDVLSIYMSH